MGSLWIGQIRTMANEDETAGAVFVEDGMIVSVGTEAVLRKRHCEHISDEINFSPYIMYPGFVDSHMHIFGHGLKLLRLDLSTASSSAEMKGMLVDKAKRTGTGKWLLGEGWNENNFADRKIFHRAELDDISLDQPMALSRVCRHAVLANSKALEMAGIDDDTEDPPGGVIVRDVEGHATGYLLDQAQFLVSDAIPNMTEDELAEVCQTAIDHLVSLGLVGGHSEDMNSYGGFNRTLDAYTRVLDGNTRRFRTQLLIHHEVIDDMHKAGYLVDETINDLTFNSMKIFSDGALGGRTALLRQPYNDAPETSGVAMHEPIELSHLVKKARHYNMPVAIHAIGDLALEYAIKAIEDNPAPEGKRDRLIHGQIAPEDLRQRMLKLPVILDIQPQFVASDFPWVIERLGEQRMVDAFAWKTLLHEGIICAGGSDAPIESANPLFGIHAAVTRRKPGEPNQEYYPDQKLTVFEAVSLYTHGSACAIGQENLTGKIAPGFQADFTILDKDLFTIKEDDILNTTAVMTVVENQIVYKSKDKLSGK